jgi:hypothetical protein
VWRPSSAAIADGSDSYRLLPDAPSFHAWLAACSMRADPLTVRTPMDLPGRDAFERVAVDGGYALVTRDGITLFNETRSHAPDNLPEVAERIAEVVESHAKFLADYAERLEGWADELQPDARPSDNKAQSLEDWERKLTAARAHILRTDTRLATLPSGFDEEKLHTSLSRMWGLHDRRDEVRGLIDRLDQLMRQSIARRTERRERVVGSLVSAAALAIALGQLWGPFEAVLPLTPYQVQISAAVARVVGFGLGLSLFWVFGIRGASKH